MKLELKFLVITLIAIIAAIPVSDALQKRTKALKIEREVNNSLNIKIDSLQKQLEEQQKREEQIRQENESLQKQLEAKKAREAFLAGLTFPVGNAPAWKVRDALAYYMDQGLTKTAASYLVGNLVAESALREDAVGDGGRAVGLAQWHPNRRYDMPTGFHDQLAFVLTEMRRQTPAAYEIITNNPTASEAAYAMKVFEAYGIEGHRFVYAEHILNRI